MKKITPILVMLAAVVLLSGCLGQPQTTTPAGEKTPTTKTSVPGAEQKSGETTKTGTISTAGGKFFLTEPGQPPREISSYAIKLADYVGKSVTVTGQYSGDTLFVGKIK